MPVLKPTVLIIDNSLYPTGAIRSILNIAGILSVKYNFQFIISDKSTIRPDLELKGYKVHTVPFLEISKQLKVIGYLPRLWQNAGRIKKIIQQESISIVHVNDLYNQLGCMLKIKNAGVPVVYHARLLATSYIARFYRLFSFLIKKYADKIISVSTAVTKDLGASGKITVIHDAVSLQEKMPAWQGFRKSHPVILYLGNYVRGKGQDYGLQAFMEVEQEFADVRLRFAGGCHSAADQEFKAVLQQQASTAGIAEKVSFDGPVTAVEQTIKEADIVLNLSESESFSMVCLEAMAYGVPLIASDCGGPRDITDNGEKAILVPNKNATAAAEGLRKILGNSTFYADQAHLAKQWVAGRFSIEKAAAQLAAVYEEVMGTSKRI